MKLTNFADWSESPLITQRRTQVQQAVESLGLPVRRIEIEMLMSAVVIRVMLTESAEVFRMDRMAFIDDSVFSRSLNVHFNERFYRPLSVELL